MPRIAQNPAGNTNYQVNQNVNVLPIRALPKAFWATCNILESLYCPNAHIAPLRGERKWATHIAPFFPPPGMGSEVGNMQVKLSERARQATQAQPQVEKGQDDPAAFYRRACPGYWQRCLAGCPDANLGSLAFCRRFQWTPGPGGA